MRRKKRIANLIAGYLRGSLTTKEHDELDEWVGASDQNMRIFEELTDETKLSVAVDWLKLSIPELLERTGKETSYRKVHQVINKSRYYPIAASIILIIAISFFLTHSHRADSPIATANAPDQSQELQHINEEGAVLTLANGHIIILNQTGNGKLAKEGTIQIIKNDRVLHYTYEENQPTNNLLYNTVVTPRGCDYALVLSDGTKVYLNAASSIRFPAVFSKNERRVAVTGEVYFEIKNNKNSPFIVDVENSCVLISTAENKFMKKRDLLDTKFNIKAYSDDTASKITLLAGNLNMVTRHNKGLSLQPLQQAQVYRKATKLLSNINKDVITAWQTGMIRYSNADLKTILADIGRWYDLDIYYDSDVLNQKYSCSFSRSMPISQLLNELSTTGGFNFTKDGRTIKVWPTKSIKA